MVFCSDNVCLMLVEFNLNCEYVRSNDGRIAQSVERSANNAVVLGSSPSMTNFFAFLINSFKRFFRFTCYDGVHIVQVQI